jgi:hypothetical protein
LKESLKGKSKCVYQIIHRTATLVLYAVSEYSMNVYENIAGKSAILPIVPVKKKSSIHSNMNFRRIL